MPVRLTWNHVMIRLDNVGKRYGRRGTRARALHDVTLHVPAGSVWAVVGPNGAGKSTLLALMLGFIRPSAGTVSIDDMPPRDYLRDVGAGYLPERFSLPGEWDVRSALRMFARLEGVPPEEADRALEQFGLASHADKKSGELSRGLLQRVGLAQALIAPRRLVVLDEPTEGLDPLWRIRLRDIVAGLRADGRTVILASHDLGEVERVADRALLLEQGVMRGILETRSAAAGTRYTIRLATSFPRMAEAFPDAVPGADDAWTVTVAGAGELTERVGALIALGGVIAAVEPDREPLEDRVRAALEGTQPDDAATEST
jgi:ABC-2 type transport system ATP-binding protein